jgi:DNA adenine methylase
MILLDEQFDYWKKVKRGTPTECWRFRGKDFMGKVPANVAYDIHHGVDPGHFRIKHTCGHQWCVNPAHLELPILKAEPETLVQTVLEELATDTSLLGLFESMDDTPQIREDYVRVPIGYPGSKNRSLDKIMPHLPYRNTYCEPFGGSAAVLFARKPSNLEVYNDRFGGITTFYRCLRDPEKMKQLFELVDWTIHSREEFIHFKQTWEKEEDDVLRAFKWYYMHQSSFGNQGRHFGRATSGQAQTGGRIRNNARFFEPVHRRLLNVQIENLDWRVIFRDYDNEETVWYLDPPYVRYSKGMYKHEFKKADHIELCERIQGLKGFVALSGYGDQETFDIYNKYDWDDQFSWQTQSSMEGLAFTDTNNLAEYHDTIKRGVASEILYIRESR